MSKPNAEGPVRVTVQISDVVLRTDTNQPLTAQQAEEAVRDAVSDFLSSNAFPYKDGKVWIQNYILSVSIGHENQNLDLSVLKTITSLFEHLDLAAIMRCMGWLASRHSNGT